MIKSKTYTGTNGLNYIQDADLVFATVYIVKLQGLQQDRFITGMPVSRTYIFDQSIGKISFPLIFDGGGTNVKIFVVYKSIGGTPTPPPGVCVPGAVVPLTILDGIKDQPYSQLFEFTGSPPFNLTGITAPPGLAFTNSGNTALLSGTPTVSGVSNVQFTLNNCVASAVPFSQPINIVNDITNMYVSNNSPGTNITSVSGITYVIKTGAFPVGNSQSVTAAISNFTGVVNVQISGVTFPVTLKLYINTVEIESVPVSTDGTYPFASHTYTYTDVIQIFLLP